VKSLYKKFFENAMIISIGAWMKLKAVFYSHKEATARNYNYMNLNFNVPKDELCVAGSPQLQCKPGFNSNWT
jgi:hypothetical protein